jgi:caa(3)-type oxidase subunit IV
MNIHLPEVDPKKARPLPFLLAWLVMIVLTGASMWTAFLHIGIWAPIAEYGIAAVQAATLFILFMRLKGPPSLKWVYAGSGFFWLALLFGYTFFDYATRRGWPWRG